MATFMLTGLHGVLFMFRKLLLIFPCTYLYLIATYLPDMLSDQNAGIITVAAAKELAASDPAANLSSLSHNVPSQDPKAQDSKTQHLKLQEWQERHRAVWKKFDTQVRQSTPVNARECGTTLLDASEKQRGPVDSCAVAAWHSHRPFRARYYVGLPQKIAMKLALIGTAEGDVRFRWIRGGAGSVLPSVGEHLCRSPRIVTVRGRQRLECKDWHKQ
jgi:hypothetical protein